MAPAEGPAAAALITVEVVRCDGPHGFETEPLALPAGASLAQALRASRLCQGLDETTEVGVWGRVRARDYALHERDRIELYRPLTVDPKEARRQRYKGQRSESARQRRSGAPGG